MTAATVYLFSYSTLQDTAVQLANFGRELSGSADAMPGYEQSWVEITDPKCWPPAARPITRFCVSKEVLDML